MIKFSDSFNIERGIEFNLSSCGKYVNLATYVKGRGSTIQIPVHAFKDLRIQICELKCTTKKTLTV